MPKDRDRIVLLEADCGIGDVDDGEAIKAGVGLTDRRSGRCMGSDFRLESRGVFTIYSDRRFTLYGI